MRLSNRKNGTGSIDYCDPEASVQFNAVPFGYYIATVGPCPDFHPSARRSATRFEPMFKLIVRLFGFFLVLALIAAALVYWRASSPLKLTADRLEFHIPSGVGLRGAAREIAAAGVDADPWLLIVLGKVMRVETAIKAGSYEVTRGVTPLDLIRKLTAGDVTQAEIVFIEGWNFRQIRDRLDAHLDLQHVTKGMSEQALMRQLGAEEVVAEGLFFPDTYLFSKQSRDIDVLARAYRAMKRHLVREWEAKDAGLPYRNPYQALIMASIIEKETGSDRDRTMIAAVFANRLRQGMLLQTDPSVIYGLGARFDGNLRKRDLLADTPYNTYTRAGLPPTPIAMPGIASLQAALHPAPSKAFYFVARGDGSSEFSQTLEEHNQAVERYQKGGKH